MIQPKGMPVPSDLDSNSDRSEALPAFLSAPLRRWKITLFCFIFSATAAATVALTCSQKLWPVEGTIIYTPLSLGGLSHGDYTPPSPQTLISLVKSPQRLEQVARDLNLPVSVRTLERSLKVNQQANVDAVRLSVDWPDPEAGRAIVDRLMDAYIRDTSELRRAKIRETLTVLQNEVGDQKRKVDAARAAYSALPDRINQPRLVAETERNRAAATALTTESNHIAEKLNVCRRELARAKAIEKAAAAGKPLSDEDATYRERKQALFDSVRVHQDRVKEIDVEIDSKKQELANAQKLLDSGVGSRLDHSRLSGELDLLVVRHASAVKATQEIKLEMAELPLRHARTVIARMEEEEGQLEAKAAVIKQGMDDNHRDLVRIGELSGIEQAARKQVDLTELEYRGVRARIEALERLRDGAISEFIVAQPAAVGVQPTSNRKTLGVLTLAGLMSLFLVGIMGHAWLTQGRSVTQQTYGLPVLARVEADTTGTIRAATESRRLALQLRDSIRQSGGLILCASADQSVQSEDVVWQLARYLSLAGEEVLILDARIHEVCPTPSSDPLHIAPEVHFGLTNYLRSQVSDELALIRETDLSGLDYLPPGECFPDPDLLASAAMQKLLVRLAEQWDRVLLLGPSLDRSLGSEILASYADGAVVICGRGCEESATAKSAVASIRKAGVPWVGAIVRAAKGEEEALPFSEEILVPANSSTATSTEEELPDEEPGVLSVTWTKTTRLRGDAPGPLESQTLNPPGGTPNPTDKHVKRSADLKAYWRS